MLIKITKKSGRNQLTCIRDDGSYTSANLGPNLPLHDMAHFVAEQTFKIENGFYGLIEKGYSIQQLSDPTIIKGLGFESWTRGITVQEPSSCMRHGDQSVFVSTISVVYGARCASGSHHLKTLILLIED